MENFKLPKDELTGDSNLNGRYRVSFNIDVSEDDYIALSDIIQSIGAGFDGQSILNKISNVGLEKINKQGQSITGPKTIKVGDHVAIAEDITLKVALSHYNGLYIVGAKSLSAQLVGDIEITVLKGTQATVNQVTNEGIELIDFDKVIQAELHDSETGFPEDVTVNLESIIFSDSSIEYVHSEEK